MPTQLRRPVGDSGELQAIKFRLSAATGKLRSSATKSATGHLLGAAGGLEAIFTVLALRDQMAPPTLNLQNPDPLADGVDLVGNEARSMPIMHAISNGFGFGGVKRERDSFAAGRDTSCGAYQRLT